eukprot:TRINITY_DN40655_c0_g1_i1.p1 TRINITY_DN40655_c0_g1~~TRINITY_DN40655_c0_g1_i1.p1  ORF type:complete len:472 (+),score=134.88 TRINITY_DN40655_c0_g1_i1:157-1572(+)
MQRSLERRPLPHGLLSLVACVGVALADSSDLAATAAAASAPAVGSASAAATGEASRPASSLLLLRSEQRGSSRPEAADAAAGQLSAEGDASGAVEVEAGGDHSAGGGVKACRATLRWLREGGADVHPRIDCDLPRHESLPVRGLVASEFLKKHETLFVVPKRLWLHLDNFPEWQKEDWKDATHSWHATKEAREIFKMELKLAAALAAEARKKKSSRFSAPLAALPSLGDLTLSHPQLADKEVRSDFGALRLTRLLVGLEKVDERLKKSFHDWQRHRRKHGPGVLQHLTWNDIHTALLWLRTRQLVAGEPGKEERTIVPGVDFLNTGALKDVNTEWAVDHRGFTLRTSRALEPGDELLLEYCRDCDNSQFLAMWGFYLEGNPNRLKDEHRPDCYSSRSPVSGAEVQLRDAAEASLDVHAASSHGKHQKSKAPRVPRCKQDTLQAVPEAPVRCAFARLAWEHCGTAWIQKGSK